MDEVVPSESYISPFFRLAIRNNPLLSWVGGVQEAPEGQRLDSLCGTCRQAFIGRLVEDEEHRTSQGIPEQYELGNFADLTSRENCVICGFAIIMITRAVSSVPDRFRFVPCANFFLDKWMNVNFFFHSHCDGDDHSGCYKRNQPIGTIMRLAKQDRACFGHHASDVPRCIGPGGHQVCTSLVRQWLRNCEELHGSRCNDLPHSHNLESMQNLLLIDIARSRLVEVTSGHKRKYVALSYVWGNVRLLQTMKANFASLQRDGALDEAQKEIPTVIRDAMKLSNTLGIRYLWVDCLCIVQDDSESKHLQLAQMDRIYREAVLTIAAIAGRDANSSLPGVHPQGRPIVTSEAGGLHLAIYQPPLMGDLDRSVYGTRGWTLQESILSRRVLFVCDYQYYFRCNYGIESEIARAETLEEDATIQNPLASIDQALTAGTGPLYWGTITQAYAKLVNSYTERELSFPEDILNAFAGFASYFDRCCGGSSIYGLPAAILDLALLWAAHSKITRRETLIPDVHGNRARAPSWSWAGWAGRFENDMAQMSGIAIRLVSFIEEFKLGYQETEHRITKLSDISTHYLYEGPISDVRRSEIESDEATSTNDAVAESMPADESKFYRQPTLIFSAYAVGVSNFRFQIRRAATIPQDANYHLSRMNAKDYDYNTKIFDQEGRHCGMFVGDIEHLPYDSEVSTNFWHGEESKWEFVLMSALEKTLQTKFVWLSYFHYFDEDVYGPEKDWNCFNVLLIKWGNEHAERFAAARIHAEAFYIASPVEKLIHLC